MSALRKKLADVDAATRRITVGAGFAAIADPDGYAIALGKKLADVEGKGRLSGGLLAGGAVLGACWVNGGEVGYGAGLGIILAAVVVRGVGILFRRSVR